MELPYELETSKFDDSKSKQSTFAVGPFAKYYISTSGNVKPFLGLGLGLGKVKLTNKVETSNPFTGFENQ